MPTGYTADVVDGKVTKFTDFALQCARAFGALITMRDDPKDALIPDEIMPSDYSKRSLEAARNRLAELQGMTPEQAERKAEAAFQGALEVYQKRKLESEAENARLDAMLAKVNAWSPPTDDHVELKSFMAQQLGISRNDPTYFSAAPVKLTGVAWLKSETDKASREVAYYSKDQAEEVERATRRTEWIRSLKASLKHAV